MLDAFIIDRIRRERDHARTTLVPLWIDVPPPPPPSQTTEPGAEERGERRGESERGDRGVVEIDFSV